MPEPQSIDPGRARQLRRWNFAVGLIHAAQATVLLLLATDVSLPVYASWIDGPPGSAEPVTGEPLFELSFAAATAAFLYLAAIDHLLVAGPLRRWYERNLALSINYARWIEYSLSASLMVTLIAMLAGVWQLTALVALFGANAAMILFGSLMERGESPGCDTDWTAFWFGSIIGAVPWLVIAIQLVRAYEKTEVPGFVAAIFFSLLFLFALFAVNMALQYRRAGAWRDYLFGERGYIVLSLTAKSALAWQVYAGALAG
jgi:Heliorhodopsin